MDTVVAPDVAVTVIAAGPVGVPGEAGPRVEPGPSAPHPAITAARQNTARHALNAKRRLGDRWKPTMAIAKNDESATVRPSTPNGQVPGRGSAGIEAEAAFVTSVSWTTVPFGGEAGVTGFDPNAQLAFAGSPEQLNVN